MMLTEKCFSLPINPKSDWKFIQNIFIPFLKEHRDVIYDLYFTCRIAPFGQDAMGDVFVSDPRESAKNALWIQEQVDIPLSATFNNICLLYTSPSPRDATLSRIPCCA